MRIDPGATEAVRRWPGGGSGTGTGPLTTARHETHVRAADKFVATPCDDHPVEDDPDWIKLTGYDKRHATVRYSTIQRPSCARLWTGRKQHQQAVAHNQGHLGLVLVWAATHDELSCNC